MGYKMKAQLVSLQFGRKGENLLTVSLNDDFSEQYDDLYGETLELEISKQRAKRSKNANAYLWEMCAKLAEATGLTMVDVYKKTVKEHGVSKDIEFKNVADAKTMAHAWSELGLGWVTEQIDYTADGDGVLWRFWYGSSTYNTKQMSRLIDSLIEDCRALGIECLSADERNLILQNWERGKNNG